ncbi:hypothetical protein LJB80_00190 [Bacteroides sp. OttesenSCG-928-F21]|nr:hypothetical protein [Bacteroides sp. OttesenSCG-928-F21]
MTKVFISGSISIKELDKPTMISIDLLIERDVCFLIGDANGVDKAAQQYLLDKNYRHVVVYFSGEKIRHNIGNWYTKQCPNPENQTGRKLYQIKDKVMATDCDFGLMLWDGKSKGTKENMDNLDALGKRYLLVTQIYDKK